MTSLELKHQANLQKWALAVQECRSNNISVKQWCRERGTTPATYYRWERELLELAKEEKKSQVSFVELPAPKQQYRNTSERSATLRISDTCSIDLYQEITPDLLKVMAEVLRSC